ncbi:MAG: tRNA (guanosine(46)-N7)-methyltransferase TrmB [Deltaproteobacteria bacterium HGW-Deltaproteobacteria-14]|jgi:tRNA (guanine-N7-)-methyltransferase|nr:MAG: tRNA (guanosine(46)-N7)-methyltransferase TrmB [Deltaproteobacteria bacterium HGW-Deltaproteobacteria-14]
MTPDVGLVGGRIEERVRHAKVPPLDLPHVLAPFRRESDRAPFLDFVAQRPLHLEIGFGRPHHLCDLAAQHPDARVLGFEIRRRWVRAADRRAAREGLDNLRAVEGDARPYIEQLVAPSSVEAVYILFPDPWWKKRHHKRRVFQPAFIETLGERLVPGGMLIVKTDVEAYADLIVEQFLELEGWELAGTSHADPTIAALPRSHREKKCIELGIPTYSFRFVREAR